MLTVLGFIWNWKLWCHDNVTSHFRTLWTPVYKKDDPLGKVNYRPVTLLTSVDKVFEQVLCRQLKEMSESILDVFMSAYRSKYSCETTLIKLVGCWKWALDLNKAVGPLSIDMSKVFHSIHCWSQSWDLTVYPSLHVRYWNHTSKAEKTGLELETLPVTGSR